MHTKRDRNEQLGAFFAANTDKLERVVARNINAPRELIEDACANAWAILVRRPDITLDARGSPG
jgi:dsDNA-binding SOS-regulon protein